MNRGWMSWGISLVAVLVLMLATASLADAAAGTFVPQFSPAALPGVATLSVNGDSVAGLSVLLRPTKCASPSDWRTDADDAFIFQMPPGATAQLDGGRFSYRGNATSAYFGPGTTDAPYGGPFSISGAVNPAHTLVTGTVSLSGARDATVSGCSGAYSFVAVPKVSGSVPRGNRAAYRSRFVDFDYAAGAVSSLHVQANFRCGHSVDLAEVSSNAYGYPTLRAAPGGRFALQAYVLDQYQRIVVFKIKGRVSGRRARGRIMISEPPGDFNGLAGASCAASYSWTASRPSSPPRSGPTAFFNWAQTRVPEAGGYRYYFAITGLRCVDRANEVLVSVDGRQIVVPCSRRAAFVSGPLAPLRSYTAAVRAVMVKHGRIVRRGVAVATRLQMPGAGDRWTAVAGLPARPPS